MHGTINNTGSVTKLVIANIVSSSAQINLGQMSASEVSFGQGLDGNLVLSDDIDASSVIVIQEDVSNTGTIDLKGYNVAGALTLYHTMDGQIIDGGDISGSVVLSYGSGEFSGSITFDSVSDTGEIRTTHGNDLNGTIHILGDVDGDIHNFGAVASSGSIQIDGDLGAAGFIEVGAAEGDIEIAGNLDSGGYVQVASLEDTGRILIDGACSGLVEVSQTMSSNALIRATGGLPSSGVIAVNPSGSSGDPTEGTIHLGATSTGTPLPDVPFDGLICINAPWKAGTMRYTGCDNDTTAPNVCAVGGSSATYNFTQTGCTYTVPTTPNCASSCP